MRKEQLLLESRSDGKDEKDEKQVIAVMQQGQGLAGEDKNKENKILLRDSGAGRVKSE